MFNENYIFFDCEEIAEFFRLKQKSPIAGLFCFLHESLLCMANARSYSLLSFFARLFEF